MLPPHFKVVQEDNFMAKVDEVVEALSVSTGLQGCALFTLARLAGDKC